MLIVAQCSAIPRQVKVKPVSGPLRIPRFCTSTWPSAPTSGLYTEDNCAGVSASETCGTGIEIPAAYLAEQGYCTGKYTNGQCYEADVAPAGAGVADADIVIFVTASTHSSRDADDKCGTGSDTAAFAGQCAQDQHDRPVAGHVVWCAKS